MFLLSLYNRIEGHWRSLLKTWILTGQAALVLTSLRLLHWWCTNGKHQAPSGVHHLDSGQGLFQQIHPISPPHRFLLARHDLANPRCLFYDMLSPRDFVCQRSKCIECDNKIFNLICIRKKEVVENKDWVGERDRREATSSLKTGCVKYMNVEDTQ